MLNSFFPPSCHSQHRKFHLVVYIANFHYFSSFSLHPSLSYRFIVYLFFMPTIYECFSQTTNENKMFELTTKIISVALSDEIYEIFIDLPENIAQIVAMTTENSTVIAPVSLNTITGTNTIIPMANRLHVPEGIMSKSLLYTLFEMKAKMKLSIFIS